MLCASFTEEQQHKIVYTKWYVKKDKSGISAIFCQEECELLGEPDQGDIFEGSREELEQASPSFYQSSPKGQQCHSGESESPGSGS